MDRQIVFEKSVRRAGIALLIMSGLTGVCVAQNVTFPAQGQTVRKLNIVIIEGNGAINNVKQRLAREVIVQVNDENDRPVGGGAVAFLLPSSGPGGMFPNGANVLNVTTNAAGRATAQFVPNSLSGSFQINVTATFQGQASTAVIPQTNAVAAASSASATGAATGAGSGAGVSATTVAIIAGVVAGAVAIGVAASKKDDNETASSPNIPDIPTIRIGVGGSPTLGTPGFQPSRNTASRLPKWR